jgi:hypothetical protein
VLCRLYKNIRTLSILESITFEIIIAIEPKKLITVQSAKYEFASSIHSNETFAFDACFVSKLAPLADERGGFFIENLSRRLTRSNTY